MRCRHVSLPKSSPKNTHPPSSSQAYLGGSSRDTGGEKGVRNLLPERPEGCFAQKFLTPFSPRVDWERSEGRRQAPVLARLQTSRPCTGFRGILGPARRNTRPPACPRPQAPSSRTRRY